MALIEPKLVQIGTSLLCKAKDFYLLFTFLTQLPPGFQLLRKFRFIISIHCISKVFELDEKIAQIKCFIENKKQKTSANPPISVTTSISYGMN